MIYLYYGSDSVAVRTKAISALEVQESLGLRVERLELENITLGKIAEMAGSLSLFGEATVYSVDVPSSATLEVYEAFMKALPELAASTNVIIVTEGALLAPAKKLWTKHANCIEEYTAPKEAPVDVFAIASALLARDKKSLWLLYTKLRLSDVSPEEIIGILWWQLKSMRLVAESKNAESAGMKSYSYDKTKQSLKNYSALEIVTLSRNLLRVYHEGHGGVKDISIGLEEWILAV